MKEIKDESFVVIDKQVAMTQEMVADLLNVEDETLRRLSEEVGVTNAEGGIYNQEGKYYYASPEIIFKVRNKNGKNSADLSRGDLAIAFRKAEDRLLPADFVKAKRKKENKQLAIMVGVIVLFFVIGYFYNQSKKNTVSTTPVQHAAQSQPKKQEQQSNESFMSDSKKAIESVTGLYVTDFYIMDYGERERPDGSVDTESFVELNSDGIKHHFWANFDKSTRKLQRLKIDSESLYSTLGW